MARLALLLALLLPPALAADDAADVRAAAAKSASAGSFAFTVQQAGTVSGLYPTGQASVPFTVKNPNPYPLTLASAHASRW